MFMKKIAGIISIFITGVFSFLSVYTLINKLYVGTMCYSVVLLFIVIIELTVLISTKERP